MADIRAPRHGSMQVWPRKRAKRMYSRVRNWPASKDAKPLGFAGYKVGMTHVMLADTGKSSKTKGESLAFPATIIECPPLKVYGIRFYKNDSYGAHIALDVFTKQDKELTRKLHVSKKSHEDKLKSVNPSEYSDLTLIVFTQPRMTGFAKKTPEIFELGVGGTMEQKVEYAKSVLGKELAVEQIFTDGQLVDIHAVTKGKGLQGPVKRFGVALRSHKSEKTKRGPGSLGPWHPHKISFRVAHLGQMGFHSRVDYNKQIIKIGVKPEEVNSKAGFKRYGLVRSSFVLLKGSVAGPPKRLIRFNTAMRPSKKLASFVPSVEAIHK